MNSELLHLILWRAVIELCRRWFQLFDLYYPFRVIIYIYISFFFLLERWAWPIVVVTVNVTIPLNGKTGISILSGYSDSSFPPSTRPPLRGTSAHVAMVRMVW